MAKKEILEWALRGYSMTGIALIQNIGWRAWVMFGLVCLYWIIRILLLFYKDEK
jgi:hypothetical protein